MLKKLSAIVTFGTMSSVLAIALVAYLYREQGWNLYRAWIVAWSLSAFLLWWIDHSRKNIPDQIFYLQAAMGGFIGAWLGMIGFGHKMSNRRLWLVLIASTIIHRAVMPDFF